MTDLTTVNVNATDAEKAAILAVDQRWTAPRLIGLLFVVLGLAITGLYFWASSSIRTAHEDLYLPWKSGAAEVNR